MRFALALFFLMLTGGPAWATMSIHCEAPNGEAGISLGLGSVPVAAIISANLFAPDIDWSVNNNDMIVGQDFVGDNRLMVDFTDPNVEGIIASVRLLIANSPNQQVIAGALEISEIGAYPLVCEGP